MDKVKLVSSTRIYLDARRLLDEVLDITVDFPRSYKFSVGSRLQTNCIDLMELIAEAYTTRDREKRINALCLFQSKFQTVKTLIRIAGEREWIKGKGRHAHIVELLDALGRQSSAWKNSLCKAKAPDSE